MFGYFKDLKGIVKCMGEDGWFRIGDVGVMYDDGYVEIKDRFKDIIISGGENISSVEVELVFYIFLGVNEVVVVVWFDEYWGEMLCVFVSLKEGLKGKLLMEREIMEYCRGKLLYYMVFKMVVIKEELLKIFIGKI